MEKKPSVWDFPCRKALEMLYDGHLVIASGSQSGCLLSSLLGAREGLCMPFYPMTGVACFLLLRLHTIKGADTVAMLRSQSFFKDAFYLNYVYVCMSLWGYVVHVSTSDHTVQKRELDSQS